MSVRRSIVLTAVVVWMSTALAAAQPAVTPTGTWAGVVVVNGVDIPFAFEISSPPERAATTSGRPVTAAFFDGDLRIESSSGSFVDGTLTVRFDQYGTRLDATLRDGRLEGTYDRGTRGAGYVFRAERAIARPAVSHAPDITGVWIIPTTSTKGEKAFRFIVRQKGADVSAAILRVDGDTGTLSGAYRDGTFVLSHFSGVRPTLLEVTVNADGTLSILQNKQMHLTAVREADARKAALPEPTDSEAHTRAKDPSRPLVLAFPSLDGPAISLADQRFAGKVVIVSITGSWCPNCHDETPFLVDLYKQYRGLGLEVVAVTFEEAAQLKDPVRVRAFAKRYGITYPILLAGEPDELNAKVPQFENLNAFPTSFYLGRDGRVRFIHAGFPSPASGAFYLDARQEIVRQVEQLLAEK